MINRNFFIIVIIFAFILYLPMRVDEASITSSNSVSIECDEIMAMATNDATKQLIYTVDSYSIEQMGESKKIDYRDLNLNLDKSLDRFYRTLYLNLNIEKDIITQQSIKHRIPIVVVTGYDGYYINYFKTNGQGSEWSDLKPYRVIDEKNNLSISFTLDDKVSITNLRDKKTFNGTREELKPKFPNSCLKDKETFEKQKNHVINYLIQQDLEYYTHYANVIAKRNNFKISYDIPYLGNRAIDSIAFMAFFQGKEYEGVGKNFISFGFGSTKTLEKKNVYGYKKDGKLMYSPKISGTTPTYFSNEVEAATKGYMPDLDYYSKFN